MNNNEYKSIVIKSKNKNIKEDINVNGYLNTSINRKRKEESSDEEDSKSESISEDKNDEKIIASKLRSKLFFSKKKNLNLEIGNNSMEERKKLNFDI